MAKSPAKAPASLKVATKPSAKAKAKAATAKPKLKAPAKLKSKPKVALKSISAAPQPSDQSPTARARKTVTEAAEKARTAAAPELERLKKASAKVEGRLKAVSSAVAAKLEAFEKLAEQQLGSEKNKARLDKIEKDVGRLVSSADQQFGKVRGALDDELQDLKSLLNRSAEKVIPAARARIRSLMADDDKTAGDSWEFYTDKAKKWRWRLKDGAGKPLGASNKAFTSRTECIDNARHLGYRGG